MTMAARDHELNQIIRGKRTKRQRSMSPRITCTESSGLFRDNRKEEEEEELANCLILLAQGSDDHDRICKSSPETAGFCFGSEAYRCKTCDRFFSSFQALGGHRASHKKHKTEDKKMCVENRFQKMSTSTKTQTIAKSNVHECAVCGAEFSSGQALGGHMRRHRTNASGSGRSGMFTTLSLDSISHEESRHETKKPRNGSTNLQLDLNLPATAEDIGGDCNEVNFQFGSKEQVIVLSSLVDCHY